MGWTVAGALGWSLLPAIVYGPAKFRDQFTAWLDFFHRGQGVGKMNLSVYAMVDRIAGHHLMPFGNPGIDNLAPSGSALVPVLWYGLLAVVGIAACLIFRGSYDHAVAGVGGRVERRPAGRDDLLAAHLEVLPHRAASSDGALRRDVAGHGDRLALFAGHSSGQTWLAYLSAMAAANVIVGNDFAFRLRNGFCAHGKRTCSSSAPSSGTGRGSTR